MSDVVANIPGAARFNVVPLRGGGGQQLLNLVPLANAPFKWTMKEGVIANEEIIFIRPQDKKVIADSAGVPTDPTVVAPAGVPFAEFRMFFDTRDGGQIDIRRLYIIDFPPGPNPNIAAMRVADRRWFWPYDHIVKRYNVRRRTGTRRAQNPGVDELRAVVPQIQYAPFSQRDREAGVKWTAVEAAFDIVAKAVTLESDVTQQIPARVIVDANLVKNIRDVPIEDLEVDDRADQAVARVLSYLPAAGLTVDTNGDIRIFNKADFSEEGMIRAAQPEIVGEGHVDFVSNVLRRPERIHVLFSYEAEIRFDFKEQSGTTVVDFTEKDKETQRLLDNVLPIPDFELSVVANQPGNDQRTALAQGTWITVDQAIQSWPAPPGIGGGGQLLTHDTIRKAFMPFLDLWAPLALAGRLAPDADWMARISALMQHYRKTFRIPQRWMDRILSLRAYRVSTVDVTTGTRGGAQAYADYAIVGSERAFIGAGGADRINAFHVLNVDGYEDVIDVNTRPIPARIDVVDADQGIISFEFLPDPAKVFTVFLPSKVETNGNPTGNIRVANRTGQPVAFDVLRENASTSTIPSLEADHKAAVILTAVPAAPNNRNQLHEVVIEPRHVQGILPLRVQQSLQRTSGIPMYVRIPPAYETARVRWKDSRALDIAKLFGVGREDGDEAPDVGDLVVNRDSNNDAAVMETEGASLDNIARAVAVQVWTSFADRMEGQMSGDLKREIFSQGTLLEIVYQLAPDGKQTVELTLPEDPPFKLSLFNFLDDGTRRIVMKLVQGRDK